MSKPDPFNWPAQNRADLMSLSTLDQLKDQMHTRTTNYRPKTRDHSSNLQSTDIERKQKNSLKT